MNFLFIYLGKKRGVHWLFTKLGRDKVFMAPAHLYWLLGQIRQGADPGQGHNSSMRGLFQRTSSSELDGYSNKLNI